MTLGQTVSLYCISGIKGCYRRNMRTKLDRSKVVR